MTNDTRVNSIVADLDGHFARNMGQKAIYLKTTIAVIQRRGENYIMYFFDDKTTILEIDIRDSNRYQMFTRDELISFLNEQLLEW